VKLITQEEYHNFLAEHSSVDIENVEVKLKKEWQIRQFQPKDYSPEEWTVWSFPDRGDWATHVGNYRGNWSPYLPRNLLDRYSKPGDLICDQMMGSGTTLVECKLMRRNGLGVDINPDSVMVTLNRLDFRYKPPGESYIEPQIRVYQGDARDLREIQDGEIDLIATHPPYCGIVSYSKSKVEGDLSSLKLEPFIAEMGKVAGEAFRILKPDRHCAILIGDTRRHQHYIPISIGVLSKFLEAGFILREDVIKLQHKTKITRERWRGSRYDFLKIAHEHLYVFRKPAEGENRTQYKHSLKWW
jgi:DNA modification methylase